MRCGWPEMYGWIASEQIFARCAAGLDRSLNGRTWLTGEALTVADFSVGAIIPSAARIGLSIAPYPEIALWYARLAALPPWQVALAQQASAAAAWQAERQAGTAIDLGPGAGA